MLRAQPLKTLAVRSRRRPVVLAAAVLAAVLLIVVVVTGWPGGGSSDTTTVDGNASAVLYDDGRARSHAVKSRPPLDSPDGLTITVPDAVPVVVVIILLVVHGPVTVPWSPL